VIAHSNENGPKLPSSRGVVFAAGFFFAAAGFDADPAATAGVTADASKPLRRVYYSLSSARQNTPLIDFWHSN
jgi:hypothetical protein